MVNHQRVTEVHINFGPEGLANESSIHSVKARVVLRGEVLVVAPLRLLVDCAMRQ